MKLELDLPQLKFALSAVITLILTVQSGADHLSGLNVEGR